jgi:hypothetical protein
MKKFTIIGFIVAFVIAGVFLWLHFKHTREVAPQMSLRSYKIEPDIFYSSLRHQFAPKEGESDILLLRRFFTGHNIDLSKPNAEILMIKHKDETDWLLVHVTPEDQDKVERLVVQIANSK